MSKESQWYANQEQAETMAKEYREGFRALKILHKALQAYADCLEKELVEAREQKRRPTPAGYIDLTERVDGAIQASDDAHERERGLEQQVKTLRAVLLTAEHSLITLHGLWATDKPDEYEDAQREGADANGARDCQRGVTWQIDELPVIQGVKSALASTTPSADPDEGLEVRPEVEKLLVQRLLDGEYITADEMRKKLAQQPATETVCPECKGLAEWHGHKCPGCNGSGKISEEVK